jgi:hypothetical protein
MTGTGVSLEACASAREQDEAALMGETDSTH